jgi:transcriptional regulator with XRE-family HTH domain
MNEATPTAPETPTIGPKEVGARMAALREQFNLSQQEVSERLHIRTRYVSAIEEARYDLMPGKVYARGYVQTYAEFLGLNPDEVVAQCFAGEPPANAQPIPPIAAARYSSPAARSGIAASRPSPWRGYVVLGVIALVIALVVSQFMGHGDTPRQEEATVAPVPEAMLASVRTMVMPLAQNYECLTKDDTYLACFTADDTTQLVSHADMRDFWYGGKLDPSASVMAVSADEAPAVAEQKATVAEEKVGEPEEHPAPENPDSPTVATKPNMADVDDGQNATPPHDE